MAERSTIAMDPMLFDAAMTTEETAALSAKATGFYFILSMYCWSRGGWVVEDDIMIRGLLASFRSDEDTVRSLLRDDEELRRLLRRADGMITTALVIDCLGRRKSDG